MFEYDNNHNILINKFVIPDDSTYLVWKLFFF